MSFVNIHGDPIKLDSLTVAKRPKVAKAQDPQHKGFKVVGVSPQSVSKARASYEKSSAHLEKFHGESRPPFDSQEWLRNAKLERITNKACATYDGAQSYKYLAEKNGWLNVSIEALAKAK